MRRPVLAVIALLVLAACRDGKADEPRTTVPTAPSTTTTTAVSYEVPATIDIPYIEKVMAALDRVDGEAARRAAAQRQLDEEFLNYYAAIYTSEYFDLVKQAWYEIAGRGFEDLVADPGDPTTTVVKLIAASATCVLFQANRDFSASFREPDPPSGARYVALVPLPPDRDPGGRNPTPWIMNFDGDYKSGKEPTQEDACAVS